MYKIVAAVILVCLAVSTQATFLSGYYGGFPGGLYGGGIAPHLFGAGYGFGGGYGIGGGYGVGGGFGFGGGYGGGLYSGFPFMGGNYGLGKFGYY